jgi:hypothetical protein
MYLPVQPPGPPPGADVWADVLVWAVSMCGFVLLIGLIVALLKLATAQSQGRPLPVLLPERKPEPVEDKPPLPDWWKTNPELMEISRAAGTVTTGDIQMARADEQQKRAQEQLAAADAQLRRAGARSDNMSQLQAIASAWRARTEHRDVQ